jgi:ADP-ribose pyrophosphatase YjhB (NUDIX family)
MSTKNTTPPIYHPRRDACGARLLLRHPSQPTPLAAWSVKEATATVIPDGRLPDRLNGLAITPSLAAPPDDAGWEALAASATFDEPPFNPGSGLKPAAGAAIVESDGRVWLVAPSNQFGGYAATLPKGRIEAMSPRATAIKEAFEETGLQIRLTGFLADCARSTTYTRYYLAERVGGSPAAMGWESQAVHLVPSADLPDFLTHKNDASLLTALQASVANDAPRPVRTAATRKDWSNCRPMPREHITVPLTLSFDDRQMARIRLGFVPWDQNQKWFIYFANGTLNFHRSWTGFCIYRVQFRRPGRCWQAVEAQINRQSEQYGGQSDEEDLRLIQELIDNFLLDESASSPDQSPFLQALALAVEPNYLGNPEVVLRELGVHFGLVLRHVAPHPDAAERLARYKDWNEDLFRLTQIFSGAHPDYTALPGWHSADQLGASLVKHFDLDADYCADENLAFLVTEALASLCNHTRTFVDAVAAEPGATAEQFNDQVAELLAFVVSVLLGTNSVVAPGKTVADFKWRPATTESAT